MAKKTNSPKKKAAKPAAKTKASTKASSSSASGSLPVFRTRAAKVEQGLKGIAKVVINAEKPNKGAFVITIGSKKVVNLTGLKRPFPKLKALDMDDVIEDCKSKL
ncbi:hypothetical protein TrCOL_g11913 [Triparma columacea]|uniref:Selenoprotein H n=1 Tax=Triparma columacea TaxID=722753 RepID=A0A9W7FYZ7_9STRA|nr:hypothetical protein TrCOL_g11913 [Triparma columacea]